MAIGEKQTLSEKLHELDGKEILGRDGRNYLVEVSPGNPFSVRIVNPENKHYNYGELPNLCCQEYEKRILSLGVADFTCVARKGLYKNLIHMISYAVPIGTSYKTSLKRSEDWDALIESIRRGETVESCLKATVVGKVYLSSSFDNIKIFYRDYRDDTKEIIYEGEDALTELSKDCSMNDFPSNSKTEVYLVAKKTKPSR